MFCKLDRTKVKATCKHVERRKRTECKWWQCRQKSRWMWWSVADGDAQSSRPRWTSILRSCARCRRGREWWTPPARWSTQASTCAQPLLVATPLSYFHFTSALRQNSFSYFFSPSDKFPCYDGVLALTAFRRYFEFLMTQFSFYLCFLKSTCCLVCRIPLVRPTYCWFTLASSQRIRPKNFQNSCETHQANFTFFGG